MKRKLIGQGAGGVTVTLPINWVREYSLEPGSEVDVKQVDAGILISGITLKKEKTISLNLSEYDSRMILNFLNQAYRLGYDTISLHYKTPPQYQTIKEITQNTLLGFEIIENKQLQCTLQNIAEPDPEKFETILRKIFLQILELANQTIEDCKNHKYNPHLIEEAKQQIDKLTNYTRRTIIRQKIGGDKSSLLYSIVSQLSLVSHAYYYMYQYAKDMKKRVSPELLFYLTGITQMLHTYYEAFYEKDMKKLSFISKMRDEFMQQNRQLLEKSTPQTALFIAHIRELLRAIHMCLPFTIGYYLEEKKEKE
jgi:phosphate uptake regulator